MEALDPFVRSTHIAYFSMEIALRPEIHTYSGGLGILAGDTMRSCADLELPAVFVTLVSRAGYLRQEIDGEGRQVDHPDPWEPERWATPLGAKIAVDIQDREVWVRPWLFVHTASRGFQIPVVLLDTDLDENRREDREITHHLYGGDDAYRLKQEIVLGIGGVRMLQALGFEITTFHLNEGHPALLTLELARRYRLPSGETAPGGCQFEVPRVRELCIFTTHTPVEAGHDRFPYDLVGRLLTPRFVEIDQIKLLAGADALNLTRLALNLSGYVNGVAQRHAETSRRMFPGYRVRAITNGVHAETWTAPAFARLYDAHFPNWRHEPEFLVRVDEVPDDGVWAAHAEAKGELIARVKAATGIGLDPEIPVIGFARRMTGYKRPDLLFHDVERLATIHQRYPFHVVLAGKAHPRDEYGKHLVENINRCIRALSNTITMAFLPNYDMAIARVLVAGCDVWLNNPLPPLEASGTSGMKAALNGVLNLGVLDGWWVEACIEGRTGWALGDDREGAPHDGDAVALYDKLQHTVLPLYHENRARWVWMMKESIGKIGSYFNSHRMMRRYATEAYIR